MAYYPITQHDDYPEVPWDYNSRFCVQVTLFVPHSHSHSHLIPSKAKDELDIQFYRLYSQSVSIPSNDLCSGSPLHYPYFHQQWSLTASDCAPPPLKLYALVGLLGKAPAYQLVPSVIPSTTATYSHTQLAQQTSMYLSTNPSEYLPVGNSYAQDATLLSRYPNIDFPYINHHDNLVALMIGTSDSLMDRLPVSLEEKTPFEQTLPAAPQPPQSFTVSSASESSDWMDSDSRTHETVPSQVYLSNDPVQVNASVTYERTPTCDTCLPILSEAEDRMWASTTGD
ncbi:hypothetical protein M404DRAFT_35143 [Pisolithus tinctorius Marx 270]|uniref:Uncharacterized protein n=1 Tax=Pisolithus tinctorius Marx 270 TaxID=870435 RepID=A0A0C3NF52_PISTI|nr:hypothetical protein M404DRAFT_35143 [Pisolithus tinctorius Marx 270]